MTYIRSSKYSIQNIVSMIDQPASQPNGFVVNFLGRNEMCGFFYCWRFSAIKKRDEEDIFLHFVS